MKTILPLMLMAIGFAGYAQTSANNPRLQEALKKYPAADTNQDGILTLGEAKAFKQSATPDENGGRTADSASKHIYKTVGDRQLELFIYRPEGQPADAKVPAIVLFHGGGFKSGSPTQFRSQAEYFASRGIVALTVTYRLTSQPGVKIEDCVEDAKSAMRWVRSKSAELGVDPDRIAAGGGSAGGYLAAATLLIDPVNAATDPAGINAKPNAMVLFNPGFGGRDREGNADLRDPEGKGALASFVTPNQPPCINFFGTADPLLAGAQQFQKTYTQAGNRCEIVTYEGQGHSFFNKDPYRDQTLAEADKFLTSLGWLAKKAETPTTPGAP